MRRSNARSPRGEVEFEVRTVAVLVCVLELVERVIFLVEELAVATEEVVVDTNSGCAVRQVVRLGHQHPLVWAGPAAGTVRSR